MDFRILRYFLTVAREQSFTKAAEQLHITQPTLSRQLAALEEELGVSLFARSGRNITLTEEGILLKRRALEILELEERTLDELKGSEGIVEGSVTIGCGKRPLGRWNVPGGSAGCQRVCDEAGSARKTVDPSGESRCSE